MAFKFSKWKPNTKPVPDSKKPVDQCAPLPEKERFVDLKNRNIDMIQRRGKEILTKGSYLALEDRLRCC